MNYVELYTIRDQLNIEIKFKLKVHVAKWSYGLRFHMMVHQYYHFQFYFSAIHFISPAENSSGSSVIESPASDPNPGFTTYPGLRAPWIFSREPWEFSGSPLFKKSFFLFFVVNLSVLSHFSLYFLLKQFTSSGNSNNKPPVHLNCQTAKVLFIQSNNQFLFKNFFFLFFCGKYFYTKSFFSLFSSKTFHQFM